MAKKIDPLNKKQYGAVTVSLTVSNIPGAIKFYQQAFGFAKRSVLKGPDGKPVHAELTLRGTTLMMGPESRPQGQLTPNSLGSSPIALYLLTENADKVVAKAVKLGATAQGPVMDMFWGDRCGTIVDPDGYKWMVSTHMAELTPQEMAKKMKDQMSQAATA